MSELVTLPDVVRDGDRVRPPDMVTVLLAADLKPVYISLDGVISTPGRDQAPIFGSYRAA